MSRPVLQAGAVAVRGRGEDLRVLLVTARRDASEWIFPKGHVDAGETLAEAAGRELFEEAGVAGQVGWELDVLTFRTRGRLLEVHYFLVEANGSGESREGRRLQWLAPGEARRVLTFEDTRRLVDLAVRRS